MSGDQPQVLEVTSDDDLSSDIIFGHLSPREGPSLTQTFPHLWQIILIILFLSPRLDAVHQNFWSLWKDHHIILKRSTWHLPAVPMLRHQKTGHVIYLSVLQKHFDIILEHLPSALWINVHQPPTWCLTRARRGCDLLMLIQLLCCGSNVQYIEIIVSRITFYQHHDKNFV